MIEHKAEMNHRELPPSMRDDLAVVSCFAAREVRNVLEGQGGEFESVKNLLKIIRDSIIFHGQSSPETMVDPSKAVAMNQALEYSDLGTKDSTKTVKQLVEETRTVANLLEAVVKDPVNVRREREDELKKLRSLCLVLSRSVIACEEPVEEELELEIT